MSFNIFLFDGTIKKHREVNIGKDILWHLKGCIKLVWERVPPFSWAKVCQGI